MTTINLFVDTEFSNFETHELISIALVMDKKKYFYRESLSFEKKICSDFVKEHVLTLLSDKPVNIAQIKQDLNLWLKSLICEEIIIVGDYFGDWKILQTLLDENTKVIGFIQIDDFFTKQIYDKNKDISIDKLLKKQEIILNHFEKTVQDWFQINNKTAHHALNDAFSNFDAFHITLALVES